MTIAAPAPGTPAVRHARRSYNALSLGPADTRTGRDLTLRGASDRRSARSSANMSLMIRRSGNAATMSGSVSDRGRRSAILW